MKNNKYMNHLKYFGIISIMMCLTWHLSAQKSYLSFIQDGKYNEALKGLTINEQKYPNDLIVNYELGDLYATSGFPQKNAQKSLDYIYKAYKLWNLIEDEKQRKKWAEKGITESSLYTFLETCFNNYLQLEMNNPTVSKLNNIINNYGHISETITNQVIEKRDQLAYQDVVRQNTRAAYENFMKDYPSSKQSNEAKNKIIAFEFEDVKQNGTIDSYQGFIAQYPQSDLVKQAEDAIRVIKYNSANTPLLQMAFVDEYPNSKEADVLSDKLYRYVKSKYLDKNNIYGLIQEFNDFNSVEKLKNLDNIIYQDYQRSHDFIMLRFFVQKFTHHQDYPEMLKKFYVEYTDDGEEKTLHLFEKKYDNVLLKSEIQRDIELAKAGDLLRIDQPFKAGNRTAYMDYIKRAAPKFRAYTALLNMVKSDLEAGNWENTMTTLKQFETYFQQDSVNRVKSLISYLTLAEDPEVVRHNFGKEVNSNYTQFSPVLSADEQTLYMCAQPNTALDLEKIMRSRKENNQWSQAAIVEELKSDGNESPKSLNLNGTELFFFKNGQIAQAERSAKSWSDIKILPEPVNKREAWQSDAFLTADGSALLFTSDREGGYNIYTNADLRGETSLLNTDIYVCVRKDSTWGEAINLGQVINTMYCERTPFLHPDMKTLYFSSNGHGGIGDLDVWMSKRLNDTSWTEWSTPVNMGKQINTVSADWGYKISTDGTKAVFAGKSESPSKLLDIYSVNLSESLRPEQVAVIYGVLLDKYTKAPIIGKFVWEDVTTGSSIGEFKTDPQMGSYFLVVPLSKFYGYYADAEGYYPVSKNIDLTDIKHSIVIRDTIYMVSLQKMLEENASVVINNIFFDFDKWNLLSTSISELNRLYNFLNKNDYKVEISGHTDAKGSDSYNQKLSYNRANSVKEYLVNKGIDVHRIMVKGYGKNQPIATNETEEGRALNRRVEFKFLR